MIDISWEKLGENIRRQREARGWSIEELAEKTGDPVAFVEKAEAGKRKITIHAVMNFCDAFGVNPETLLGGITIRK